MQVSSPGWEGPLEYWRKCNPLQYSCLEDPMDGGAWWAAVPGVTVRLKQMTEHSSPAQEPDTHGRKHLFLQQVRCIAS